MLRPAAFLLLLLLPACARDRVDLPARRAALEAGLADGRRAHFATDARLLAAGLDDTLESLDAGARSAQPRDSVRAMFSRYFAGAAYRAWENLEPPRITLSDDGSLAAVLQMVCVDREEPDGQGERRRRVFVTAYSFELPLAGRWVADADGRLDLSARSSRAMPRRGARCGCPPRAGWGRPCPRRGRRADRRGGRRGAGAAAAVRRYDPLGPGRPGPAGARPEVRGRLRAGRRMARSTAGEW